MGFSGGCVLWRGEVADAEVLAAVGALVPAEALVLLAGFELLGRAVGLVAVVADRGHPGNDHLCAALARAVAVEALALTESDAFQCAAYELRAPEGLPGSHRSGGLSVLGGAGALSSGDVVRLGVEALLEVPAPEVTLTGLLDLAVEEGRFLRRTAKGWATRKGPPDLDWLTFGFTLWPAGHLGASARYAALR